MQLSRQQRKSLLILLRFKEHPTIFSLLFASWPIFLVIFVFVFIQRVWIDRWDILIFNFIAFSAFFTARLIAAVRVWPVTRHIIDWDRAKALLASDM